MKKNRKILFVVVLLLAAAGVLAVASRFSRPKTDGTISRESVVNAMQSLDIRNDMKEEDKQKAFEDFKKFRDTLNQQNMLVNQQGEQSVALVYWPLIALGNLNRDVGDFAKAELAYHYASQIQPGAFVPYANLGELYFRYTKEYKKAEEEYLKAAAMDNPNLDTIYGELYELERFFLKNPARTEAILIEGVNKYPRETNILAQLAFYYRDTGQTQKAIDRYEELLAKYPESTVAKQALAELKQ